jgi:hypothetical protein
MISPVSSASAPQPVAQTTAQPAAPPASSQAKPQVSTTDTVQISNAARAMMREAIENPAQTAREAAAGGDHQAMRLMAKEAAARASEK